MWLLYQSGTWHQWDAERKLSCCGKIAAKELELNPALKIQKMEPDPSRDRVCLTCWGRQRREGAEERAKEWVGKIKLRCRHLHVKLNEEDIEDFADLLAREGSIYDSNAITAFEWVSQILLKPVWVHGRRNGKASRTPVISHFHEALNQIPSAGSKLRYLAYTIATWRRVTGRDPKDDGLFNPAQVVQAAMQLPEDLEGYFARVEERGYGALAAAFHTHTLEYLQKHDPAVRGLFWDGEKRTNDPSGLTGVRVVGPDD